VIEKGLVTGVDQYTGRAINKIGITIVGCHRLPDKGVKIICDLHQIFPQAMYGPKIVRLVQTIRYDFLTPL
jgi:hypothetical protein